MDAPRVTTLDSGVRVVTESMDSVRSVALGFWIGTGSSTEDEPQAGLSHLLEHMLFRGTDRYGSLEIDQLFDAMGAELNAGTGKETTSVYARVLDVHLPEALDVIADMVWRPRFAEDDLDNERQIVLEEIAMYEDDPQDKVFDVLGEAVFGDHPLGRAIIGRADVVAGTPRRRAARASTPSATCPDNVVVAAAGSVDHDDARRAASPRRRSSAPARPRPRRRSAAARRRTRARVRFLAQGHRAGTTCASARPGIARDDERRYALRVLDNDPRRHVVLAAVPGGARAARPGLQRLLVPVALHAGTGQVGLYLGTRPDNVGAALRVVGDELEPLASRTRPTADELRAREGERQGPHRARARVDRRADEPPRARRSSPGCRC